MLGIYVHVPFCLIRCGYCNFHVVPVGDGEAPYEAYARVVLSQLENVAKHYELHGREIASIYFGGGTPSLLPPAFFRQVLEACGRWWKLSDDIEITSEANPASATHAWLEGVREAGVNRISLGIQSFVPRHLTLLDRDHTANDIERALRDARTSGFETVSGDVIFGIPDQTQQELEDDVATMVSFGVNHFSAYQLTFEPGTPLNQFPLPQRLEDDAILDQMRAIEMISSKQGLARYEISNFARAGKESKHNLNYWRYGEYLGLGSGAVSFLRESTERFRGRRVLAFRALEGTAVDSRNNCYGMRWHTTRNVEKFLQGEYAPRAIDQISHRTAMGEFCFLGLRTREGISFTTFEKTFGVSFASVFPDVIERFEKRGFLIHSDDRLALTDQGMELSNEVFREFV